MSQSSCTQCPSGSTTELPPFGEGATNSSFCVCHGGVKIASEDGTCRCPEGMEEVEGKCCPEGSYYDFESGSVRECAAGYSCIDPAEDPQLCDDGYFSPGNQKLCSQCPAGRDCSTGKASV